MRFVFIFSQGRKLKLHIEAMKKSRLFKAMVIFFVFLALLLIVAFAIFYRSDLTREDLADPYLNDESQFFTLSNGAEMHYRDEGTSEKQALVLIHGGFGSLHNWEGWIEPLKNDFRLISMDLLGHGLTGSSPENIYTRISQRDAIHELLQHLGIQKYIVAGNSFGGGIALEMALAYPEQVTGLILIDTEGIPNGENGYDASMFSNADAISPDQPEYSQLSWLEKVGSKFISPIAVRKVLEGLVADEELLTDDFVYHYARILRYEGNREAQLLMFRQGLDLVQKNGPLDLLPRLSEIQCPTLVLHGREDQVVPLTVAEKITQHLPHSSLTTIDQAGHMPMIEKPTESAQAIKLWRERVDQ